MGELTGPGVPTEEARRSKITPFLRTTKMTYVIVTLLLWESLIFGVSVLPGLLLWRSVWDLDLAFLHPYVRIVIIAMTFIPAYFVFAVTLMFTTAFFVRTLRWHTPEGDHKIADLGGDIVRWARGSAAAHLVRVFTGEIFRTSPIWTAYVRAMGAKVGKNVWINTTIIYDFNLLEIGDNTVVGGHASVVAHSAEKGFVRASPVKIGKNVVIGVGSIITPGVRIGDNAQVGALSFVPKNTVIPPNCAVGGVPVKLIKHYGKQQGPTLWESDEFVLSEQA